MVPDHMPEKLSCSRVRFDLPATQEMENPTTWSKIHMKYNSDRRRNRKLQKSLTQIRETMTDARGNPKPFYWQVFPPSESWLAVTCLVTEEERHKETKET